VFDFNTRRTRRFIADWVVENMNHDMNPYGISLYVKKEDTTSIKF
jgi:hypothetical protein